MPILIRIAMNGPMQLVGVLVTGCLQISDRVCSNYCFDILCLPLVVSAVKVVVVPACAGISPNSTVCGVAPVREPPSNFQ